MALIFSLDGEFFEVVVVAVGVEDDFALEVGLDGDCFYVTEVEGGVGAYILAYDVIGVGRVRQEEFLVGIGED